MEMLTVEHLVPFIEAHQYLGYLILFFVMMLEGEVFLLVAATLAHLGAFRVIDVFVVALAGVVLGNIAWYHLGSILSRYEWARAITLRAEQAVDYFLPRFRERPAVSIFISKFIYGVNHAVVFMSGVMRIDTFFFLKLETAASVVWVAFHTTVGYLFGYTALQVTHKVSHFALLITTFVVVFILLQKLSTYGYELYEQRKDDDDNRS